MALARSVFLCGALFACMDAAALTPQEIYRHAERQVLVLEVLDEKGEVLSYHTALFLDKGRAVTQCDLLEGTAKIRLRQKDEVYLAKIERADRARNLCQLSAPGLNSPETPHLTDSDPAAGAPVYALSNALGQGISIAEGIVSGIRQANGESYIQFTAAIAPGSEGGGLFDAEGRLVGIINYRQRDGQNVNFAFPARWLRDIGQRAEVADATEAWRTKASLLERESKWQELVEHAQGWTKTLTDSAEAWLWLGFAHEQRSDWPAAEKALREAHQREPASIPASIELASVLLRLNEPKEALGVARSMLAYRQEDGRIWLAIGLAQSSLGQAEEARQAFESATRFDPWNRRAYVGLANLARQSGDWSAAVAAQRQVVRIAPDDLVAWTELSEAYLRAGRRERALASADRAVELFSTSGDAWFIKGAALHALKRDREAIEILKKGLTLQPRRPAWGWAWLGDIYYARGLYPEAIAAFREALRLEPDDGAVKGRLGIALKDDYQFDEALSLFEMLKANAPGDPFPWRQLGYVHSYLAQWDVAIPAYEQALSLDPNQPKVWQALMESYHAVGRQDDVKRAYRKLLAVDRTWAEQAYRALILPYGGAP